MSEAVNAQLDARCACLRVEYKPIDLEDGAKRMNWQCRECGNMFVPAGVAVHATNLLEQQLQSLTAERDRMKEQLERHSEVEASVCPEDVGFPEYVKWLESEIARLKEKP